MFESKASTSANNELSQREAELKELNAGVAAASHRLAGLQQSRLQEAADQAQAQDISVSVCSVRDASHKQLAEMRMQGEALKSEIVVLDASAASNWHDVTLCKEKLRRLHEKHDALASACEGMRPPPAAADVQLNLHSGGDIALTVATAGSERWRESIRTASTGTTPAILEIAPLHFVAAEAGEIAMHAQEMLQFELAAVTAKSKVLGQELRQLEKERSSWEEELQALKQEHDSTMLQHRQASQRLSDCLSGVEELRRERAIVQGRLTVISRVKQRLEDDCTKVQSNVGTSKRSVEDIRGLTWQQLKETQDVVSRTSASKQRIEEETRLKQKELEHLSVAHSRAIERDMTLEAKLKTSLVAPDSVKMMAALQQAEAASLSAGQRAEFANGTSIPPPLPPKRERLLLDGGQSKSIEEPRQLKAVVRELDGDLVWAPDLGPGCGPMARPRDSRKSARPAPPPTFQRATHLTGTATVPAKAAVHLQQMKLPPMPLTRLGGLSKASTPRSIPDGSHAWGPREDVESALGEAVAVGVGCIPALSARTTPRSDPLRDAGQLVLGGR